MVNRFLILILVFTLASCAGTKKKTNVNENDIESDFKDGLSLQLNGDSDSGQAGGLKTIYFDYNSAQITRDSKFELDNNVVILNMNPSIAIQVEGHTDERGGAQFNLSLGEKRAKSVRDYLSAKGIASSRLTIISLGKERPVSYGHDDSSWSKNRRANFVITTK